MSEDASALSIDPRHVVDQDKPLYLEDIAKQRRLYRERGRTTGVFDILCPEHPNARMTVSAPVDEGGAIPDSEWHGCIWVMCSVCQGSVTAFKVARRNEGRIRA